MRILFKSITWVLLIASSLFSSDVGKITSIKGSAVIDRNGASLVGSLGAKLKQKDIISTKEKSKVQVIFNDKTIINIGKNSKFSISDYLFEDNKTPIARFSLLKGAIRTVTGKIGKIAPNRFTIKTKTATIGIRGTIFSILMQEDGSSEVFCTFGAISVEGKNSLTIVPKDFYVTISSTGEVSNLKELGNTKLNKMKNDNLIDEEITESFITDNEVDLPIQDTTKEAKESVASQEAVNSATDAVDDVDMTDFVEDY